MRIHDGEAASNVNGADKLDQLDRVLDQSMLTQAIGLGHSRDGDGLVVSLHGQPIGRWCAESIDLALYRPGSTMIECRATTVSEAAAMTARLAAAAGQA